MTEEIYRVYKDAKIKEEQLNKVYNELARVKRLFDDAMHVFAKQQKDKEVCSRQTNSFNSKTMVVYLSCLNLI
jgi:hypothetical protein